MAAFSFTAPTFTEQDALTERESLAEEVRQQLEDECFGRVAVITETPELVANALRDMDLYLASINDKPEYEEVLRIAPHLVEQESPPIRFLRCECFNPGKAARRLVKYWEVRKALFEDLAFLPMRLDGALQNDIETMKIVPDLHFVTGKDAHGRLVLSANKVHLDFNRFDRQTVNRVAWYHIHIHLGDPDVQRKGLIIIGFYRINSPKQFDRIQTKMALVSIREALPIKLKCAHICHPPLFFNFVYPMIKFMMGQEIRLITRVHTGSAATVVSALEQYGISRNNILKCMGGTFEINIDEWWNERLNAEGIYRRDEAPNGDEDVMEIDDA